MLLQIMSNSLHLNKVTFTPHFNLFKMRMNKQQIANLYAITGAGVILLVLINLFYNLFIS